uniref:Putative secreted protein n=1 Tax=Anopheles darlingi TaxID=43151 RepID=A0A2M4DHZ1_ANODA
MLFVLSLSLALLVLSSVSIPASAYFNSFSTASQHPIYCQTTNTNTTTATVGFDKRLVQFSRKTKPQNRGGGFFLYTLPVE